MINRSLPRPQWGMQDPARGPFGEQIVVPKGGQEVLKSTVARIRGWVGTAKRPVVLRDIGVMVSKIVPLTKCVLWTRYPACFTDGFRLHCVSVARDWFLISPSRDSHARPNTAPGTCLVHLAWCTNNLSVSANCTGRWTYPLGRHVMVLPTIRGDFAGLPCHCQSMLWC